MCICFSSREGTAFGVSGFGSGSESAGGPTADSPSGYQQPSDDQIHPLKLQGEQAYAHTNSHTDTLT